MLEITVHPAQTLKRFLALISATNPPNRVVIQFLTQYFSIDAAPCFLHVLPTNSAASTVISYQCDQSKHVRVYFNELLRVIERAQDHDIIVIRVHDNRPNQLYIGFEKKFRLFGQVYTKPLHENYVSIAIARKSRMAQPLLNANAIKAGVPAEDWLRFKDIALGTNTPLIVRVSKDCIQLVVLPRKRFCLFKKVMINFTIRVPDGHGTREFVIPLDVLHRFHRFQVQAPAWFELPEVVLIEAKSCLPQPYIELSMGFNNKLYIC